MKIDELEKKFRDRIKVWSKKMKVFPYEIRLKRMQNKWGYCTNDGVVYFNSEFLFMDKQSQDLVIVHELLHIKFPKHGKLFNSMMNTYLPNWESIEEQLSVEKLPLKTVNP